MQVNLFFDWLCVGELLTLKTGPPCIVLFHYTPYNSTEKCVVLLCFTKSCANNWQFKLYT